MKYIVDHDYHIHSFLSPCSSDPEQNPETILDYARRHNLKDIVLTDHFWDETVPCGENTWQGYSHISKSLPLPQDENIRFHFGCECDVDRYSVVGMSKETAEKFDFIIVPLNHMHLGLCDPLQGLPYNSQKYATAFIQRIWNLLQMDLPFHKMGLAHLTWLDGLSGTNRKENDNPIEILRNISDEQWKMIFTKANEVGIGIEINENISKYTGRDFETILHPYVLAMDYGCKFYIGTDAHHPQDLDRGFAERERLVDFLGLPEEQKFNPFN